ncbi:hypothetical protein [Marivirga harenae]|uniref:hypothetical protein n=1 Tax=Marivirga harenae TaxID=2010992 RepID=UPI0026DED4F8|nr:hypothetical protein [Marivirga harenae]WKV14037.1 hypothetical protein Q3Y49_09380 [Marivirga harenae]
MKGISLGRKHKLLLSVFHRPVKQTGFYTRPLAIKMKIEINKTFKLKKGEISFDPSGLKISDNSKKQNLMQLLSSGMWTIYGVISVFRYFKTGDQFLLWSGLFIGLAHLVLFSLNLFRSNKNVILFDDIKSIKVGERFSNKVLDIRLKNNRLRRVTGVQNSQELDDYINQILRTR